MLTTALSTLNNNKSLETVHFDITNCKYSVKISKSLVQIIIYFDHFHSSFFSLSKLKFIAVIPHDVHACIIQHNSKRSRGNLPFFARPRRGSFPFVKREAASEIKSSKLRIYSNLIRVHGGQALVYTLLFKFSNALFPAAKLSFPRATSAILACKYLIYIYIS